MSFLNGMCLNSSSSKRLTMMCWNLFQQYPLCFLASPCSCVMCDIKVGTSLRRSNSRTSQFKKCSTNNQTPSWESKLHKKSTNVSNKTKMDLSHFFNSNSTGYKCIGASFLWYLLFPISGDVQTVFIFLNLTILPRTVFKMFVLSQKKEMLTALRKLCCPVHETDHNRTSRLLQASCQWRRRTFG